MGFVNATALSRCARYLWHLADNIDSVVLRRCLEGLCEVIDPVASVQDKDVVVSRDFARIAHSRRIPVFSLLAMRMTEGITAGWFMTKWLV